MKLIENERIFDHIFQFNLFWVFDFKQLAYFIRHKVEDEQSFKIFVLSFGCCW